MMNKCRRKRTLAEAAADSSSAKPASPEPLGDMDGTGGTDRLVANGGAAAAGLPGSSRATCQNNKNRVAGGLQIVPNGCFFHIQVPAKARCNQVGHHAAVIFTVDCCVCLTVLPVVREYWYMELRRAKIIKRRGKKYFQQMCTECFFILNAVFVHGMAYIIC